MPACPLPPLGLEDLITGPPVKPESHAFLPGDRLLLYTDGVVEARNRDNSFFALPDAMEGTHADTPSSSWNACTSNCSITPRAA